MAALDHGLLKEKINKNLHRINSIAFLLSDFTQHSKLLAHSVLTLCHQLIINSAFALHTNSSNGGLFLRPTVLSLCVFRFWRAQA